MIVWILDWINAASSAIMKIEVEMTHTKRTKNKMADSDCGLRHNYLGSVHIWRQQPRGEGFQNADGCWQGGGGGLSLADVR